MGVEKCSNCDGTGRVNNYDRTPTDGGYLDPSKTCGLCGGTGQAPYWAKKGDKKPKPQTSGKSNVSNFIGFLWLVVGVFTFVYLEALSVYFLESEFTENSTWIIILSVMIAIAVYAVLHKFVLLFAVGFGLLVYFTDFHNYFRIQDAPEHCAKFTQEQIEENAYLTSICQTTSINEEPQQ